MQIRRVLAAGLLVAAVAWPVEAQRNNDRRQQAPQRPPQEQQDIETLVRFVDAHQLADPALPRAVVPAPAAGAPVMSLPTPQPADITMTWESNHFIRAEGGVTYIPYTLKIDRTTLPAAKVAYHVRLVDEATAATFNTWYFTPPPAPNAKNQPPAPTRPAFAWNDVQFIELPEGSTIQRAIQAPPGKYVAYVAIKEVSPPPPANTNQRNRNRDQAAAPAAAAPPARIAMVRQELTVPDYTSAEFQTSSLLLASNIEPLQSPLSPAQQQANPYVIGPMRITPALDGRFAKDGTINLLFWIYGATTAVTGKPDVTVDFLFHRKQDGKEAYFNRTPQQPINATTLPPDFPSGTPVVGDMGTVPAKVFPAGDYRLEIKVTDKPSGKTVTQNLNFTVLPA